MSGRGYDRYASTVPAWHDGKMNGISSTSFPKNPINFYYTLHSYKLSLVNGDRLYEEYIPYLTDISGKLVKPDYNPLGDGTFEGWYLDPSFQQPYEGDMTMPKGLVLYAKWNPVTYPVIFKDSMDETNIFDTQNIPRGKTVNPFIPEKPGFIFKGWFNDKECTQAFDYATQINEPKEIYAKWETSTTTTYTVIFQTSDGTVIRKDETHSGKVGATVIVNAIKPEGEYSTFIPDAITKTHVLDPNPDNNVIIFIYSPVTDLSYKVQYKYGDVVVTETDEIHSEANYVKVTADMSQILPKGYKSADGQLYQWVTLSTGENIVVFNVEPATYSIEYDLKDGSMKAGEVNPATYVPIELTDEGILLFNPIKYGYTFTGWKLVTGTNPDNSHNPLATVIGKGSYGNLKFEAGYELDDTQTKDLSYTVQHVVNGEVRDTFTEESTVQVLQPDTLVRNETLEADQNYEGYVKSEVAYEDGSSVDGNEIASKSVLVVSYEVDKNGDKIPDKYQTIFKYESADLTKGTVSVTTEEVHTFRDIDGNFTEKTPISPDGATATAKDGNAFEYWTDTETKDPTSDMSILKSKQYLEDTTFTAYFDSDEKGKGPDGNEPDGVPDKYETIFVYKSADVTKGTVDADPLKAEVHVFKDADGNYTEKTPVSPKGANAIALDGFAFDYWTDSEVNDYTPDMLKMKSNTYLVDTTFTAYFDVDEIGTEEPNTPDGVPDKYQIMFQYVSEDTNHGTVSGAVTEVKTIYEIVTGEDGNDHRELRPARPNANVTVSGIGSYSFNNWTDGSRSYANADEIKAAEFTQSTTFTAQFNYNGGGGGTGGGGGGTSGGATGNRRYTSTPGGPGSTTITPEDVPLAPLPELPVDVTLIDDGEVPLAPLPKTGQTSKRTTLTMILSGIFVAVSALSRKRKEEDS